MYAAVMIPVGRAMTAIPTRAEIMVMTLPAVVTGDMSPYPIVVIEIVAQYKASRKLLKRDASSWKISMAEIKM